MSKQIIAIIVTGFVISHLASAGEFADTPGNGRRLSAEKGNWQVKGKPALWQAVFGGPELKYFKKEKKKIKDPKTGKTKKTMVNVGKTDGSKIIDMVPLKNGSLIITGIIHNQESIPKAGQVTIFKGGKVGECSAFVAHINPDGKEIKWFSVLPAKVIEPERMAVADDGTIYFGGAIKDKNAFKAMPQMHKDSNPDKKKTAIVSVSSDGKKLLWLKTGAPNQSKINGMDIDNKGRIVYTGMPSGRGQASYVLRMDKNGNGVDFDKGKEDGSPSWAIYLHPNAWQLNLPGQYMDFYKKAGKEGFDYDGPEGKWGKVKWGGFCHRIGGEVIVLPDGDYVVSAGVYYSFRVGGKKSYPAFDYFLARYRPDGTIKWSTNLYQDGDSVHTPDQKPIDLAYSAKTDSIYCLVKQHGSNVYRFKGNLQGDTGNLMISWVGKVNAKDGKIQEGWYFQNSRNTSYNAKGEPKSPPYPKLAGNNLQKIAVDKEGRVYLAGTGAPKMWTSPNALMQWPAKQNGGGQGAFIVLDQNLNYLYATCLGNGIADMGGEIKALALTDKGIFLGGMGRGKGLTQGSKPIWAVADSDAKKAWLININWK